MIRRGSDGFEIQYHQLVVEKDIPETDTAWRERIQEAIEKKLTVSPEVFGRPLRKSLKGYRKLRVGDYRVVFKIESRTVFILLIKHRSIVYREIFKRMR